MHQYMVGDAHPTYESSKPRNKQQTTNNQQQTTNNQQPTTNNYLFFLVETIAIATPTNKKIPPTKTNLEGTSPKINHPKKLEPMGSNKTAKVTKVEEIKRKEKFKLV